MCQQLRQQVPEMWSTLAKTVRFLSHSTVNSTTRVQLIKVQRLATCGALTSSKLVSPVRHQLTVNNCVLHTNYQEQKEY